MLVPIDIVFIRERPMIDRVEDRAALLHDINAALHAGPFTIPEQDRRSVTGPNANEIGSLVRSGLCCRSVSGTDGANKQQKNKSHSHI